MPSVLGRQIVINRGEGSYIFTEDGQKLFDASAGLWHTQIGHGRKEIAEVAAAQIEKLETYHMFGRFLNDKAVELSNVVSELIPIDNLKIVFNSGGSDSADLACKLARRYWQVQGKHDKQIILSREFAYHGLHAFGTSVGGLEFNRAGYGTESLIPETARVSFHDIAAVEAKINEIGADKIAAIIAEPIIGAGGVFPPEPGYLEGLDALAKKYDLLFIVDEVITGFGRTGKWFATERWSLQPDMITMAKGITSGYAPLGGVAVAPRVWEPFFTPGDETPIFRHGVTYSGHALACAIALRNIEIMKDENLVERAAHLETVLRQELTDLASHELVADCRVGGFLGAVEVASHLHGNLIADELIERGFVSRPLPGNALQISPPLIAEDQEIVDLVDAIRDVLDSHN
jgi:adenosylmethionine-8-amino-7-oxononanoate aminotransferase